MVEAFAVVVIAVAVVFAVIGIATLGGARRSYDDIGHGALSLRDGTDRPSEAHDEGGSRFGTAAMVREEEIRQLLEARNAGRVRRGQAPLDVEAELARLTAETTTVDPALRDEVRALVEARNARLVRRGQVPLDVEAEVARRLDELT